MSQRRRRPEGRGRLLLALVLALVGHAVYVGLLLLASVIQMNVPPLPKAPRAVTMRPLSASEWAANRGAQAKPRTDRQSPSKAANAKERPKPEEDKPEPPPKGQVVEVAPGNDEEAADAEFLAERSNRVKKETRAREQTPFYKDAAPRTTASPRAGERSASAQAGNDGSGDTQSAEKPGPQKPILELPDVQRRSEIAMRASPADRRREAMAANREKSAEVRGNSERLRIREGSEGHGEEQSPGRRGDAGKMNLMPSSSVVERIVGAAPNDRLEDVEEGDGTFLNTREWKYASFFNRVKQSVGMNWNPHPLLVQRDPTGTTYAGKDRYTMLSITLDQRGMVRDIAVEKSSGLDFLDLEAIASFKRAQPFPNPPPGLVSADSTVQFSFGFYLEMGGGPRMRLFRQAD